MAENKTILELNEVTANASGDTFVVVQGGVTQKTTMSKIFDYLSNAFNVANYYTKTQTDNLLATKIGKQSTETVAIDATETSDLSVSNCVLSISNIPSGTGNKTISIRVLDDALTIEDIISTSLIYRGFDVNLRSWVIREAAGETLLELFINVHSSPTEPILIAINKIN
jgi:hypothetical protein